MRKDERSPERADNPLGFALDFLGGRAHVTLGRRHLGGVLRVDRLAMEVPDVSFPFDVSGGAGRFRHRRCRLRRFEALVEAEAFTSWFTALEPLAAYGFHGVQMRWLHGSCHLEGVARLGERQVPFTTRLSVAAAQGLRLRLTLDNWHPYGYLPIPAPLLGVGLLAAAGVRPPPEDGPSPPLFLLGATSVEVDLLGLSLRELLPAHGWRLPATGGVTLERLHLSPEGLSVVYSAADEVTTDVSQMLRTAGSGERHELTSGGDGEGPAPEGLGGQRGSESREPEERATPADGSSPPEVAEDPIRSFLEGERLLATGDVAGALVYYEERHREDPEDPLVLQRLLELLACAPHTLEQARRLARRALADEPENEPALFVLASTAEELGEVEEAASRYAALASVAERRGDMREAVLATLACGRLLSAADPAQSITWYERALALDPEQPQAVQALIGHYRAAGRIQELLRLQRRHLARAAGRRERLRGHLTLGEIYLHNLEDALRARAEFERAVRLDDGSLPAWNGLAEAHRLAGAHDRERKALERVVALCESAGDREAVSLARRRMAQAWADAGDIGRALEVTGDLMERSPQDLDAMELHGRLSARAGQWEQAAETLESLLASERLDPHSRSLVSLELAKVRLEGLADPAGARIFVDTSLAAEESQEALDMALSLALEEQRMGEAAELLGRRAALESDPDRRAALLLKRAEVLMDLPHGEAEALECLEPVLSSELPAAREGLVLAARIHQRAQRRGLLLDVLRELAVHVFAGGSLDEEDVEWMLTLGELLAEGPEHNKEARRQLRRLHAAVPNDPRPLMALTDLLTGSEEQAEREALLERLATVTEGKGDARRQAAALKELGGLRKEQDRLEDARLALQAAARLSPGDPDTLLLLGSVSFALGQWEEAEAVLGELIESEAPLPGSPGEVHLLLGRLAARRGDIEESIELLRRALDEGPSGVAARECHDALPDSLSRAGRWAEAAEAMEAAAGDERADIDGASRVERLFAAAEVRRRRLGDPEGARGLYGRVLRRHPDHLGALNGLTVIAATEEDWEEVARLLERKIDLLDGSEDTVTLLYELATLFAERLQRPQAARAAWERLLELEPDHREGLLFVGRDALECGDHRAAARAFGRLLELPPPEPGEAGGAEASRLERLEVHRAMAQIALAESDLDLVREHLGAVLEVEPADAEALEMLDELFAGEGQWSRLAEVVRRRAELEPDPRLASRLLLRLSVILDERLDRPGEAAAVCREILRRVPDDLAALNRLAGLGRRLQENPVERRRTLERILEISEATGSTDLAPRGELLFELGRLLRRDLGEREAGARLLEEAYSEGCRELDLLRTLVDLARQRESPARLDAALGRLSRHTEDRGERLAALCEQAALRLDSLEDPDGALEVLEELPVREWEDDFYVLAARAHGVRGEWSEAVHAHRELASRAQERGDEAASVAALEAMLTLAAEEMNDPDLVADTADRLLRTAPDHEVALARLTEVALKRRRSQDLLSVMERRIAAARDREDEGLADLLVEAASMCLIRLGRAEEGMAHCEAALDLDPAHVAARFLLAQAAAMLGDPRRCVDELDELVRRLKAESQMDPGRRALLGGLLREIADLWLGPLERPDLARATWRAAAAFLDGDGLVLVLVEWARQGLLEEEWAEAAEALEWLRELRSDPRDALDLASAYEHLGRLDDGLRVLRDAPPASAEDPELAPEELARQLRLRERQLLGDAGRFSELARALEEDARRAEDPARRHELLLEAAEHYQDRAGDPARAERCLLLVLEENPASREAITRLVASGRTEHNSKQVLEGLRRAGDGLASRLAEGGARQVPEVHALEDEVAELLSSIATHRLSTGGPGTAADAYRWLDVLVERAPHRLEELLLLAEHKERAGEHKALSDLLERACASASLPEEDVSRLKLWQARVMADHLDEPERALGILEGSTEEGESDASSLELRAALLERLHRLEEAEAVLGMLALQAPDPIPALTRAAELASRREDWPALIANLWRLVDVRGAGLATWDLLRELADVCARAGDGAGRLRALELLVEQAQGDSDRAECLAELGDALAAEGSWARAQERLGEAVSIEPGRVDLHLRLAEVASKAEDIEAARLALVTAHDLLPEEEREERALVSLRRSGLERDLAGDRALARRYARQAAEETRLAQRRTQALRTVAELARDQEDTVAEEEALRDLFDLGVAEPLEVDRLASLCEERGAWTDALEIHEHLRQLLPSEAGVLRRLAMARRWTDQSARAADALEEAAAFAQEQGDSDDAARDLLAAAGLLVDEDSTAVRSRDLLLRALSMDPALEEAFELLRARCLLAEDHERLIEAWSLRLPALSPEERQGAYKAMAQVASEGLGDLDRAASFWALGLAAGPEDASLLAALVIYHAQRQEWLMAWDYGQRLRELGGVPGEEAFEVHLLLAEAAEGLGDRPGMRAQLRQVLVVEPGAEDVFHRLEQLLVEDEAYEELLELVVDRAHGWSGPERAGELVRAAQISSRRLDRPQDAIRLYEEALEADPDHDRARSELMLLLREGEHWADLYGHLQEALQHAFGPARAALADELADLAIGHLGDPAAAQEYRRQALRAAPSDVRRLRALVDLLANQRQWTELVELLDEALDTMVLDADSAAGFFALLGRTYLEKLERPDLGLEVFERARARGALTARSGELLVEIYEASGRFRDLSALLEELAERSGDTQVRQRLLVKRARVLADHLGQSAEAAAMLLDLFRVDPQRRRKLGRMARKLLVRARLPVDALDVLDEELQVARETEHAALHLERGVLLETELDRSEEGLEEYLKVLELAPGHLEAHMGAARVLFERADLTPALDHAEAAIRAAEGAMQAAAHTLAAEICQELDRGEDATAHLVAAARLDPTNLDVLQALVRLYTALGSWEKLAEAMGKEIALTVEPRAASRLWYRRALLYRDILNRGGDALRCFREAASVDPDNLEAVAALRDFALERGDWETSLSLLERELAPDLEPAARAALQLKRADLLENRLGRLADAVEAVEEAAALMGDQDPEIRRTLARLLRSVQRFAEAADVERALAAEETDPTARAQALMRAASLYRRAEEPEEAFAVLAEVVRSGSQSQVQEASDQLLKECSLSGRRGELIDLFEQRLTSLEAGGPRRSLLRHLVFLATEGGDAARAEGYAEALFSEDPNDRSAFLHRRRVLEREQDFPGLVSLFKQRVVTASAEEKLDLLLTLGALQRDRTGDLDGAAQAFDEVLALRPDDLAALDARADLAFARGEFSEAQDLYDRLGDRPGSLDAADLAFRRGVISEALGDEDGALAHYASALKHRAGHLGALEALARLQLLHGQDADAAATLEALVEVVPPADQDRLVATGIQLARVQLRLGSHDLAAAGLERLHQSHPDRHNLLAILVEVYRSAQRFADLADTYHRLAAITEDPARRARLLFEEGRLLADRLGDDQGAARCFLEAADLDSDDPEILARVASHYARVGRFEDLLEAYAQQRRILEERGDVPPAAMAVAILGSAVAALVCGGERAREAPAIIRQMRVSDLNPEDATLVLADVAEGLFASSSGEMALRRVFDLLDSALGRGALPTWCRTGERLAAKDPSQIPLRRLMARLCARLGDSIQAGSHKAVLRFLLGEDPAPPLSAGDGASSRGPLARTLGVFGPAVPDEANVPLRSVFFALHPQIGRLAPPMDPSELGPEVDSENAPALAEMLRSLKDLLDTGPVGVAFARRPRAPVSAVFSLPPVLLVDRRIESWPAPQAIFVLARALELVRSGSLLLLSYPAEQVRLILDTVAQMFDIPLPKGATPDRSIERRLQERGFSTEHFDNATMETLQVAFFNHLRSPVGLAEYRAAALEAANRVALLSARELDHSLLALAVQLFVESGGDLELGAAGGAPSLGREIRESLLSSQPQISALMRFGTSSLFPALLRRRVTMPRR